MRNVARQLRERDPEAIIVVAADNDPGAAVLMAAQTQ